MDERRFKIDEKSLPNLPGMMLVVIEALKDLGGSATIQELDEKVLELEGVTEAEKVFTMAGDDSRMRVNYYLALPCSHICYWTKGVPAVFVSAIRWPKVAADSRS